MKITAGQFRGRTLVSPRSAATHPMGSRERLALFNMLNPHLPGANVLDAYAGTGALGLEALSRGAVTATFIESNPAAFAALRQNIQSLGLTSVTTPLRQKVAQFHPTTQYDLILADPPYSRINVTELAALLTALRPGGLFALSHPADFNHKHFAESNHLQLINTKSYAAAHLSIFQS